MVVQTLDLLRFLGSPFEESAEHPFNRSKQAELYQCARKNRILYLYLHTIYRKNPTDSTIDFKREKRKYLKTIDAITKASQVLAGADIDHAIFKTIRPYESTTVDIDILIFGGRIDYLRSFDAMRKAGYKTVAIGPQSTTLKDPDVSIGIDLYENVAVSFITYLDKRNLVEHATTIRMPNGLPAKTLKPHADLAAIIAHSIMKEQMYTLSEYYTFLEYLKNVNTKDLIEVARANNIMLAMRAHSSITALLHNAAHRSFPDKIKQILAAFGEDTLETTLIAKKNLKTPHKYHPLTIAKSLLEITKGEKSRNSIATQIIHTLHPKITKDVVSKLLKHVTRETY